MHTAPSSAWQRSLVRTLRPALLCVALPLLGLAGCGEHGPLDPAPRTPGSAPARAGVIVTPDHSVFDTRAEFNAAGVVDQLGGFEELTGAPLYTQPTPWTSGGVTYTSSPNVVIGPGAGLGLASNAITTEFGAPVTGQLPAGETFTRFGADLTLIGSKVAVDVVLYTDLGSYAFAAIDVPLATAGRRFFGVALTRAGEHLIGFKVTPRGSGSAVLLDDVALGPVGVANAAPVAAAAGPYVGTEGAPVSLSFGGTDADDDALTFAWDLGDGTTGSGPTPPSAHTYADDGSYDIMLAISDGRGGADTARTTATISNVAPAVAAFSLPETPVVLAGAEVTVAVATTYTDPGTLDTHVATLDCGAGATVQASAPNGTAAGACTFSGPGVYRVRMTVIDDDGGSDSEWATGAVVIYDPAAGWVTGGGWIASPAGASAAPGRISFTLAARYEAGAPKPIGAAEFNLVPGRLHFQSSALEWLVVDDGDTAQLQGRGMLNGADGYGFALTAVDGGGGDAIHLRIWNVATGETVFDSQPGDAPGTESASALGGGSIRIHHR